MFKRSRSITSKMILKIAMLFTLCVIAAGCSSPALTTQAPPATQALATQPAATTAPATQASTTQPAATTAPATQAPATQAAATQPSGNAQVAINYWFFPEFKNVKG